MSFPKHLRLTEILGGLDPNQQLRQANQLILKVNDSKEELQERRNQIMRQAKVAERRELYASEQREVDALDAEMVTMRAWTTSMYESADKRTTADFGGEDNRRAELEAREQHRVPRNAREGELDEGPIEDTSVTRALGGLSGGSYSPANDAQFRDGTPLGADQTFVDWVHGRRARDHRVPDPGDRGLDVGRYLRGLATADWTDADNERRAMSEGVMGSGGYAVPSTLSAQIVDLARNQTRVLRAGARIVPMATRVVDVPTWASDVDPAWRGENAPITEDDATIGKVRLSARSLAVLVKVSRELMEDSLSSLDDALKNATATRFAISVDYAALYGDGTPTPVDGNPVPLTDAPVGVKNTTGVTLTALAANGAELTYDDLIDGVGRRADVNETVNAAIMSPRTRRGLSKLKDANGNYLRLPDALANVPLLDTNQVPNNLDQGTAVDVASDVHLGDWSQLYLGLRTDLRIFPLNERYADTGQIGFLFWWRGDVAVARTSAFEVLTGAL